MKESEKRSRKGKAHAVVILTVMGLSFVIAALFLWEEGMSRRISVSIHVLTAVSHSPAGCPEPR